MGGMVTRCCVTMCPDWLMVTQRRVTMPPGDLIQERTVTKALMETGLVFNIQRYSIHDGPGIRTTVFLKGCPLDCWWCHNPESQEAEPEVVVIEGRCVQCGECRVVCPQEGPGKPVAPEPPLRCTRCGACVEACPTGARQMVGRRMTVAEVMAEAVKDRIFYEESGGGVTFSGGEPLVQPKFLAALLDACHAEKIHTAVDTCGFASQEDLLAVAPLVDLFLYDLKSMDEARHTQYTGISNVSILENLQALSRVHKNIWIRVPIIPGVNDDTEQLEALARCAAATSGVRQVNVLPYHEAWSYKSARVGKPCRLENVVPPSAEFMKDVAAKFRAFGLNVKVGG
jgi:pyruvate formate lyase activating enzyme